MRAAHHIPDAWPALMHIDTVCAYLDGIDARTFRKICPVPPLDMGANLLMYSRSQIDAWVASLRPRLPKSAQMANTDQDNAPVPSVDQMDTAHSQDDAIMEKVRRRASERAARCRKTA